MNEATLKRDIRNNVLVEFARQDKYFLPVAVSARHVHLSKKDFEALFGSGKTMTRYRELSQPGQFACEETMEVAGPKGSIKKVRILGPERNETQVEISISDSYTLGIKPEIRMSGDIAGTPGCTLTGPAGKITISRGVIVAARHVHLSEEQAAVYRVKDGDTVFIKSPAPREGIIGNITVRVGKDFDLEVHLDIDEANGNGILCGSVLEAGLGNPPPRFSEKQPAANSFPGLGAPPVSIRGLDLVTERDINAALIRGEKTIYCAARGFISPAAADRAREKGITICKLRE